MGLEIDGVGDTITVSEMLKERELLGLTVELEVSVGWALKVPEFVAVALALKVSVAL